MKTADLPRCHVCDSQIGLSLQWENIGQQDETGNHWCPDCMWKEVLRLRDFIRRYDRLAGSLLQKTSPKE